MEERTKRIYKDLEDAIETENEEETEKLVNLLAKEKGMTEKIEMPKDFVKQIQKKEGRKIMASKGRVLKIAAASLAAVCALGGTTYAATHWNFDDIQFTDSGVLTVTNDKKEYQVQVQEGGDGIVSKTVEEDGSASVVVSKTVDEDGSVSIGKIETGEVKEGNSGLPKLEEPKVKVLEEQEGTKDTNWIHKVTKLETSISYGSDDGKKWKANGENKYQYTNFIYHSWEKLFADKEIIKICNEDTFKGFDLGDSKIVYKEGHVDAKEKISDETVEATYQKGEKKIELSLRKDNSEDCLEEDCEVVEVVIPSEDGKSENQRYYTTKENVKYALEDVKRDGGKSTFAYLSGNGYAFSVFFTNMSEKEIQNVLDGFDATALLKKNVK